MMPGRKLTGLALSSSVLLNYPVDRKQPCSTSCMRYTTPDYMVSINITALARRGQPALQQRGGGETVENTRSQDPHVHGGSWSTFKTPLFTSIGTLSIVGRETLKHATCRRKKMAESIASPHCLGTIDTRNSAVISHPWQQTTLSCR